MNKKLLSSCASLVLLATMGIHTMNNNKIVKPSSRDTRSMLIKKIGKTLEKINKPLTPEQTEKDLTLINANKDLATELINANKEKIAPKISDHKNREKANIIEQTKMYIENNIDKINAQSQQGSTWLMNIAINGPLEIAHFLIEKGADLNMQDQHKATALMKSIHAGQLEIATLLIEKGADLTLKNIQGYTALDFAHDRNLIGIAQLIEERKEKATQNITELANFAETRAKSLWEQLIPEHIKAHEKMQKFMISLRDFSKDHTRGHIAEKIDAIIKEIEKKNNE